MRHWLTQPIFLSIFLLFANTGLPHGGHGDLRHWEIASPDPDRIFLTFLGDPATSRAVTWRTDATVAKAEVQIAKSTASPRFSGSVRVVPARTETVDLTRYSGNAQGHVNYHSAVLDTLDADTLYAYRVGDGDRHWSELSVLRENVPYPVYEMTSSSFNQIHARGTPTQNQFRADDTTYHRENYGVLAIDWDAEQPTVTMQIRDIEGVVRINQKIRIRDLQP